ncbi:MAG: arylsulfatase [Prolixibacteraceae bacterium]|jgi:arylsulfatase A-like enzyme|nr:arylsulfatase [Prolixibacteraceae bacterium]
MNKWYKNKSMKYMVNGIVRTSVLLAGSLITMHAFAAEKPNIILIYADDLGYGDISCYGATKIQTPNIDHLAENGIRFTNAYATSATCTPSRYSLLTGEYAWRKKGTKVAPGDAAMIISTAKKTLPSMLQKAGYATAVVGKWHLGLGSDGGPDWNSEIKPGPKEIGFDYSFLIPATGDRTPCVFVENGRVVGLDPQDPIQVSYKHPVGDGPTVIKNPELLKMRSSYEHDNSIVNGIGRIGYMKGGKSALWVDEDIADVITGKAKAFVKQHKNQPFFLYFSTHDIHVPRVPHQRFAGKTALGPRGDAILQLDWCVGEIVETLEKLGLKENTLILFTSDNGPVVDDGYHDQSVELLNGHTPWGQLRGGKYSVFEAGTRIPFIVYWPSHVKQGVSDALISQIDLFSSFASLTGQKIASEDAPDSYDMLPAILGETTRARDFLVEHGWSLSVRKGNWKYIEPSEKSRFDPYTNIELGNAPYPQLYDLSVDQGEKTNLADKYVEKAEELAALLDSIKQGIVRSNTAGAFQESK